MTYKNIIGNIVLLFCFLAVACNEEPIIRDYETVHSDGAAASGRVVSKKALSGESYIYLIAGRDRDVTIQADEIYYSLPAPAAKNLDISVSVGTEYTPEYKAELQRVNDYIWELIKSMGGDWVPKRFQDAMFPVANVQVSSLSVPAGKSRSESLPIILSSKGMTPDSLYCLPVRIETKDSAGASKVEVINYYVIVCDEFTPWQKIRTYIAGQPKVIPPEEVTMDEDFFLVYYINTELYSPLAADCYIYDRTDADTFDNHLFRYIGNIVNLRISSVNYDKASARAELKLEPDLKYVLEHAEKYIRPLQARKRKVCLCINGGTKGISFCNMNDAQIADFVAQVRNVVTSYGLDGVNLWDDAANYGKEGFPAMNTTSFPKLIKALKEAMPDKILTLVDKDEPTGSFYDVDACGGIEVGKYLDYAWHGYSSEKEKLQFVDPWDPVDSLSTYRRKPIAGFPKEKYGCLVPQRKHLMVNTDPTHYEDIEKEQNLDRNKLLNWNRSSHKHNNMVVLLYDFLSNERGGYEGSNIGVPIAYIQTLGNPRAELVKEVFPGGFTMFQTANEDYFYNVMLVNSETMGGNTYSVYRKDW